MQQVTRSMGSVVKGMDKVLSGMNVEAISKVRGRGGAQRRGSWDCSALQPGPRPAALPPSAELPPIGARPSPAAGDGLVRELV